MYKNNRYIQALQGEELERPPVWMMRQAGRFLPEFRAMKEKYDFFTRCQTPELAAEITLMPIERYPLDAAILFSDILVIPQAMGLPFEMKAGIGPWLENPIQTKEDIEQLQDNDISPLQYVFDAIDLTIKNLDNRLPLIGFAGSPWTILCYCVEGRGSKDFSTAKGFCFKNPDWADELLQKITNITILYLKEKVKHGVASVQLFDSWGGLLSYEDYEKYSWKYLQQIVDALSPLTNVIVFGKGCWHSLNKMAYSGAKAVGVDWTVTPKQAREWTQYKVTLQGNYDPSKLLSNPDDIYTETQKMIREFGPSKYVANLGHGILPNVPLANAEAFIQAVIDYES